jgi:sialate O-acetylesterase
MGRTFQSLSIVLFSIALCVTGTVHGEIRLPSVFADGMVLQRDQPVALWGWAGAGEEVKVSLGDKSAETIAGADGRWRVQLPKLSVQRRPQELHVLGAESGSVVLHNVLVGDVWLCSGPSNLFWPVKKCDNAESEMAGALFPQIRFFTVKRDAANAPKEDCVGAWAVCSPDTVGEASGIGYFFSRRVHREMDVPIGLLQSFWGGSRMESWTSAEALEAESAVKPVLKIWDAEVAAYDKASAEAAHAQALEVWNVKAAEAKVAGKKPLRKPRLTPNPVTTQYRPSCLYNGMIAPLIPYGLKGAMIYQGNGNLARSKHAAALLTTQIEDWRNRWGLGPIPIGLVQPAPYEAGARWNNDLPDAYSRVREAQLQVVERVPHVGLALTMDVDAVNDLHFTNKQIVAERLGNWALTEVYGRPRPFEGPILSDVNVVGGKIRIDFHNTAKGLSTRDGKAPAHFSLAAADGVFHAADAKIVNHTVIVESASVTQPVELRFAWENAAVVNLVNSDGLPASLFRIALGAKK